jgi:hypothetical protein
LEKSDLKKRFITYIQAGIMEADKWSEALRDSIIGGMDIIVIVSEVIPRSHTTDTEYCLLSIDRLISKTNPLPAPQCL